MYFARLCYVLLALMTTVGSQAQVVQPSLNPNDGKDTSIKSIRALATGTIGKAQLQILYHSPRVRNRLIWGGLVPYGEVWVTGAHMATRLETNQAIAMGDVVLPPGKYALFTIPDKATWTFIINKNYDQHLTDDYDPKDDLLRITVPVLPQPESLERLQYFIVPTAENKGILAIQWEKVRIEVPFSIVNGNSNN